LSSAYCFRLGYVWELLRSGRAEEERAVFPATVLYFGYKQRGLKHLVKLNFLQKKLSRNQRGLTSSFLLSENNLPNS